MYRLFHQGVDLDLDSDDPQVSNPSFPLIRDSYFTDFISLCFSRATFFSMTQAKWSMSTDRSLENALKPYLEKKIKTCKWFCYEVQKNSPLEVSLFLANESTKSIILKYFNELFLSHLVNGKREYSFQTLEDLCFFDHDKLFCGTVTHEDLCLVYPPDEKFEYFMKQNRYWIPVVDSIAEQIYLSQYYS